MGIKYRPFKSYKEGFDEEMEELKKKQQFWDSQATKGDLSGTRDRYAKKLEMAVIAKYVKDGMRVLDVGCGDGEMLMSLARSYRLDLAIGVDSSKDMISIAQEKTPGFPDVRFLVHNIKELTSLSHPTFDLIYTQRALINLDSWEEQRQAILDILSLLKPGGTYVMVECFQEGLQEINELRLKVGLESIVPPWHNRYLKKIEVGGMLFEQKVFDLIDAPRPHIEYFSGAYYFMSRVVQAWWRHRQHLEPAYDHALNELGTLLPPEYVNLRGQTQAWIIKKRKGK